jgi:hypothetical protein
VDRLWANIDKRGSDERWPWMAFCLPEPGNYGQVRVAGRSKGAHRLVYELTVGPIPEGLLVLHSCDNPPCCNPAHLRVGTQKENIGDAIERNRLARGRALPQAKLTEDAVREIRRRSAEGKSQRAVAAEFGVTHDTVGKILRGKRWTHVV